MVAANLQHGVGASRSNTHITINKQFTATSTNRCCIVTNTNAIGTTGWVAYYK